MTPAPLPDRSELVVGFAHSAYRMADEFRSRGEAGPHFEARSVDELRERIADAHVLVVSGFWRNEFVERAPNLRFIQSISAGTDQYDRALLGQRGIRLASAQGANEEAVAEHAMALILGLARFLHIGRDNQAKRLWRGMISDPMQREKELAGSTLLVVGLGRIGTRLAGLARAFRMRVIGLKRDPSSASGMVDAIFGPDRLHEALAQADFVALTCPLTPETEGLIGPAELKAMRRTTYLINVARGRVVDEAALIAALERGLIAGAGLDCVQEEPLPASSPLWRFENVMITPHTAGETQRYESNVIDLLQENLARLYRGETTLKNQIV
jgi:D-2-hydroxyacid dehydrogenase (NADP+)